MSAINSIKRGFANEIIRRCSEKNCKLRLDGLRHHVVLKGEKVCQDQKICDCIIFAEDTILVVGIAELKGKTAHSSEIEEKLTNGSQKALDILEKCCNIRVKFEFYHMVLCKSWSTSEYSIIASKKIWVRGKRYDIIPKKCGISFSSVISSLG